MGEIVRRAAAWGVAGMLVGPAAVYCLMLLVLYTDPGCQAGLGAGCKLDIALNLTMGVIAGFALFFGVTFIRGLMRR
ncbi:MAG TPA: hypothetical protein VNS02_13675 [Rhizobiaceae bacterium]|nr:hypothetical protein [Rhizobiaceae bacterium]